MHHEFEHHGRHHHRHGMGRHRGGRGFGPAMEGFMGGGHGRGHFRMGRKLGAGDLALLVLALLKEKPSHGYEIIKALEERSNGFYSPSPGMIYPTLTHLEELDYASVEAEGTKKLYRLTPAGVAHLEKNKDAAELLLSQLAQIGRKMERMRRAISGEEVASEDDERGMPEIVRARRALKSALRDKDDADAVEQMRIVVILKRAAKEIRGDD
jgi:DNA-binding PadR family transcriptional regulator